MDAFRAKLLGHPFIVHNQAFFARCNVTKTLEFEVKRLLGYAMDALSNIDPDAIVVASVEVVGGGSDG